jgi:hypothetical protein
MLYCGAKVIICTKNGCPNVEANAIAPEWCGYAADADMLTQARAIQFPVTARRERLLRRRGARMARKLLYTIGSI